MAYTGRTFEDELCMMSGESIKEYFDDWKALMRQEYAQLREAGLEEEDKKELFEIVKSFNSTLDLLVNQDKNMANLKAYRSTRKILASSVIRHYYDANEKMVYLLDKYHVM